NRIKWCHGDLHSGNIFLAGKKIYIFDCIEFNERFAIQDVASDVAFLAMDLEFHGKKKFAELFVEKYLAETGDQDAAKLLIFYKCYRAFVRGKISSFQNKKSEARKYFGLARNYAKNL
ncbi:MAG: phosphotransferase, partial [Candidatus Nealsonbacteria bacterium]|nr:phosphotransferase [Candidatus Nealsonbacteria bacterium]